MVVSPTVGILWAASVASAQTLWPLPSTPGTPRVIVNPCDNAALSAQSQPGQCPDTCQLEAFSCGDAADTTIPGWQRCDGINDCPTNINGQATAIGAQCRYQAGIGINDCATDEAGANCGGMIDTLMNGGIAGLQADGTVARLNMSTDVNERRQEYITAQLESSFRWSFWRAIAERRTSSDCDLYMQKEQENEGVRAAP